LSTDPRQTYVSYLSTDALATSINQISERLSTKPSTLRPRQRELLESIMNDMVVELFGRQLELPLGPVD
jgi:hypothetical protein